MNNELYHLLSQNEEDRSALEMAIALSEMNDAYASLNDNLFKLKVDLDLPDGTFGIVCEQASRMRCAMKRVAYAMNETIVYGNLSLDVSIEVGKVVRQARLDS